MAKVVMYGTGLCPFCAKARKLLDEKSVTYHEIRVDLETDRRPEMERLSGGFTVPQIFINGHPIGGYTDMADLNDSGRLDELLAENE